jgi:hypothetical protein
LLAYLLPESFQRHPGSLPVAERSEKASWKLHLEAMDNGKRQNRLNDIWQW